MRNPLSAILQCSDEISATLTDVQNAGGLSAELADIIESNIDAAQTITLCAQHQKRIVDDVLTLSKLDSAMLLVTPTDSQPVVVVQRSLKMFEGELQNADITLELKIHDSFHRLNVDWVRLDPSRLLQILINLLTNAIKFTTSQDRKTIIMQIGASLDPPTHEDGYNVTYVPVRNPKVGDSTATTDWGHGESIYIHFAVQDTGRGLTESEIKMLFQRFSQASPRTHVQYGGSGLGLFICRELVELQGGQIGVASESGKGSTFAFYVKSRRSSAPVERPESDIVEFPSQRKGSAKGIRPASQKSTNSTTSATGAVNSNLSTAQRTMSPESSEAAADVLRVLVVEDNLVNQKVLAKQLRKAGCIVYLANHGGEAIEQIQRSTLWHSNVSKPYSRSSASPTRSSATHNLSSTSPDVIEIHIVLLDLEMPVMDGQTCARKIRQYQKDGHIVRHVPVIAVTANARAEQIRNTLDAGIDDVVSKPFRLMELLPRARSLISKCDAERSTPEVERGITPSPRRNQDTDLEHKRREHPQTGTPL
jgi:CheY-like chemotaxis protein